MADTSMSPSEQWSDLVPGIDVDEDTRIEASLSCATRVSFTFARGVKLYVATDPASNTITSSPSSSGGSPASGVDSWGCHDLMRGSNLITFARERYGNRCDHKAKLRSAVPRINTAFNMGSAHN